MREISPLLAYLRTCVLAYSKLTVSIKNFYQPCYFSFWENREAVCLGVSRVIFAFFWAGFGRLRWRGCLKFNYKP